MLVGASISGGLHGVSAILYYAKERPHISDVNIKEIEDVLFRETKNHDTILDFTHRLGKFSLLLSIHNEIEDVLLRPSPPYRRKTQSLPTHHHFLMKKRRLSTQTSLLPS